MSMTTDVDDNARSILSQLPTSVKQHTVHRLYSVFTKRVLELFQTQVVPARCCPLKYVVVKIGHIVQTHLGPGLNVRRVKNLDNPDNAPYRILRAFGVYERPSAVATQDRNYVTNLYIFDDKINDFLKLQKS